MAANTSRLKTFALATRVKLISLISARLDYLLSADNAETRGWTPQIAKLREAIDRKGKREVIEEVAYTWFNRIMALRYMDANGFNSPMVVSIAEGQTRPQILDEGMAGSFDDDLNLTDEDKLLTGPDLYRKLLVASCNRLNEPMPFLFEHISDYTEMLLPDDLLSPQSFVTDIRNGMTDEDCADVEVVGWLYQFYINDRKDEAEKNKSRHGGLKSDEQAAATQLFTPHWIVRYMVENSLGRIWMTLHPESRLVEEMPYYLAPVEGQTDRIPEDIKSVADIRFLDPCMGSGHVLVYAFDLLTKMYEEEGFPTKKIPGLIFENNLFGIDIDRRCYQLASFALTMKARAYYSRFLRRPVQPKVIALQPIDRRTIEAAGAWPAKSLVWEMENLDTIGSLLKITPEESAAINVDGGVFGEETRLMKEQAEYLSGSYHCVVTNPPYLGKGFGEALKAYIGKEYPNSKADTMATFMERCMDFSATNGKMAMINMQSWMFLSSFEKLRKDFIKNYQIDSLLHLGPRTFDELSGEVVQNAAFVVGNHTPSLSATYCRLIDGSNSTAKKDNFLSGENRFEVKSQNTFEKIPGSPLAYWVSDIVEDAFTNEKIGDKFKVIAGLCTGDNANYIFYWAEVSKDDIMLPNSECYEKKFKFHNKGGSARKWYGNHDFVVNYNDKSIEKLSLLPGFRNDGNEYFYRPSISWAKITARSNTFRYYPKGFVFDSAGSSIFGDEDRYNYIMGLCNSIIGKFIVQLINPTINASPGIIKQIPIIELNEDFISRLVSENISISKQDWDAHETSWDFQENELISLMKKGLGTFNNWVGSPDNVIQRFSYLNLLVEEYKSKWEEMFHQLHQNEEELNRKFIEIYGLQDELTPDVPLEEVTILQKGEINWEKGRPRPLPSASSQNTWEDSGVLRTERGRSYSQSSTERGRSYSQSRTERGRSYSQSSTGRGRPYSQSITERGRSYSQLTGRSYSQLPWQDDVIIKQFISYLVGCFMGRYSVDRPGLLIANQGQKPADLDLPQTTLEIDDDGIIPIIQEEDFFADDMTARVETAIEILFGKESKAENLRYIRDALGMSLRDYFFKEYYKDHLALYSVKGAKRPIYWLFSSKMGDRKKKGAFKALVYMHRMEGDTLSKLHADYVHPYIEKLEREFYDNEKELEREDLPTKKRNDLLKLSDSLRGKIREVKDFETELVKMASARPTFDLDDGVATNYPRFYPLVEPIKGLDA